MILKSTDKVFTENSRVLRYGSALSFIVSGLKWPVGAIGFTGSQAFSISISCEDGNRYDYNSVFINGSHAIALRAPGSPDINPLNGSYSGISFSDGINRNRTISILINGQAFIQYIAMNSIGLSIPQKLGIAFNQFPLLENIDIVNLANLTDIDDGLFNLNKLKSLSFSGTNFLPNTRFYGVVAPQFLNINLTSLTIGGSAFAGRTFAQSKLNEINGFNLPNLQYLGFNYCILNDNGNGSDASPIPAEWGTITTLQTLAFNAVNGYTKVPSIINTYSTSIKNLYFTNQGQAFSWSDISNLTNLTILNFLGSAGMTAQIPSWFGVFIKLKTLDYRDVFVISRPSGDVDTFIDGIYAIVIQNAMITGTATSPFRSMTIRISGLGTTVQTPTGIYQQPAGYIPGISNGVPANSLEKIWIMVNQYGHLWAYN